MKVDVLGMWQKAPKARLFSMSPSRKMSVYSAGKTRWVTVVSRWHSAEEGAPLELLTMLSFSKSPMVGNRLSKPGSSCFREGSLAFSGSSTVHLLTGALNKVLRMGKCVER